MAAEIKPEQHQVAGLAFPRFHYFADARQCWSESIGKATVRRKLAAGEKNGMFEVAFVHFIRLVFPRTLTLLIIYRG